MKIASYNVNSIRSRLHIVLPWLQKNKPDYFCMQETKVEDAKFPTAEFENIGYQIFFRGFKQYNGVAIASKQKPEKITFGFSGKPEDPDRFAVAHFGDLVILNVYVPQGQEVGKPQFDYKLAWLDRLKKYLRKNFTPQEKLILCGDFNVAPLQIDVYNPKTTMGHVAFNPYVWKAYEELISWGLMDIFRRHHPDKPGQFTFFDYRVRDSVGRNMGWRVDHILATKAFAQLSKNSTIDMPTRLEDKPSDHVVVYAQW